MVDHVFNRCKAGVQNLPLDTTSTLASSSSHNGATSSRDSASAATSSTVPSSLNGYAEAIAKHVDAGESNASLPIMVSDGPPASSSHGSTSAVEVESQTRYVVLDASN
jgi:hypothetical protein